MITNAATSRSYPKRPQYFAQKVTRLLVKTCATQEIGQAATLLVVVGAATEDAARYRRPVTFFNDQLLPLIGLRKWEALDNARKAAVNAGWLNYEPPPKGTKKPGRYWAAIPAEAEGLDDSPVDESNAEPYPPNGYGGGYGGGYGDGDGGGELSYLTLNPSPKKEITHSKSEYTSDFEAWWKVYPRKVGKRKAFGAWKTALPKVEGNGKTRETLLEITQRFAASPAGNAGEFTPHPATWLNQGRYEDDPAEWQSKTASKPSEPLTYRDDKL